MTENTYLKKLQGKERELETQLSAIRLLIEDELRSSNQMNLVFSKLDNEFAQEEIVEILSYGNSIKEKFINVLKSEQRFMKVREIAEEIASVEGGSVKRIITQLSQNTRILKDLGKIVSYQHGNSKKNTFWGSPKWMEGDNILPKYKYKEDAIHKTSVSNIKDLEI